MKESSAESRLLQVCISGRWHFYFILRRPLFEISAEYWPAGNITENCIWLYIIFIFFSYFWRARVCWPLLCLCCPFCIFERCLDSNPESCRSKQALPTYSHSSPSNLATHLPPLSHPSPSTKPPISLHLATHLPQLNHPSPST